MSWRPLFLSLAVAAAALAGAAHAEDLAGTYAGRVGGQPWTLVLRPDGSGELASGTDRIVLRGAYERGGFAGSGEMMGARFQVRGVAEGRGIRLRICELDGGTPDETTAMEMVLERAGTGGAGEAPPPGGGGENPLGGGNPLAGGAPAAPADPFVGRFRGQAIALELAPEGGAPGRFAGTLTFQGQAYPARAARASIGGLEGSFVAGGNPYPFTATLRGATLVLASGGQTYTLEKEGPPAGAPPGTVGGAAPLPAPPLAGGQALSQTYKHAVGFTLRYPAGWTAQETAMGLVLSPGDAARNAQGPTEVYVVMGNPTQAQRPDDPQVGQAMDLWVAQNIPGFQRAGAPEAARSGDRAGAVYTWSGRIPQTGAEGRVRVYVTILSGHAVGVVCLGEKAPVDARDATIRAIFDSFGMGAAQLDPVLVGTWYKRVYTNIERTPGVDGSGINTASIVQMVLQPDGTCVRGAWLGHSSPGGIGEARNAGVRGRWGAANGTVTIVMDDGTTFAMTYHVQGQPGNRDMLLTPVGGGKKDQQLWGENPNRD